MAEQKAEKAGGITNLGKTVGAPASTFSVCSRAVRLPEPTAAGLDFRLGGKIVFPDERMEGYPDPQGSGSSRGRVVAHHFGRGSGDVCFRDDFLPRVGVHARNPSCWTSSGQHGADDPP
ncbi:MAG: hypothetical protein ACLT2T_13330 [Bilophila wadsworthia]